MNNIHLLSILAMSLIASSANAQWKVINLHPAGATESLARSASGGQQVGEATVAGVVRASLWSGTANSWVNLNPAGANWSNAWGASSGQQVGYASVGGSQHAGLWNGTAASWIDLNPPTAGSSNALATSGSQQVGEATVGGVQRASMWSGSAASWVDLSPTGATWSNAFAVSGGQQVGYATVGGVTRASLWSGTAASWVDLKPAGVDSSVANGADGGQQVGAVNVAGVDHASLWRGTAGSWVDLSPTGATWSNVFGVSEGEQVGYATVGGVQRASLWNGTAGSRVDLHALLSHDFTSSGAYGICHFEGTTYVVGYGYNSAHRRLEALMWSRPISQFTLSVRSANPAAGVPVTVWTTDRNGEKNGITTFDRSYNLGTVASLTAPPQIGTQWFERWELDGQTITTNRTISVTMAAYHTAKAVFVTGRTLTVRSQNPNSGVPITVYQVDKQGLKNGTTQFTRTYGQGATVSLTAPAVAGTAHFVRWLKDGNAQPTGVQTISVSMIGNRAVTAVYAP